jgi:hypothetical protein
MIYHIQKERNRGIQEEWRQVQKSIEEQDFADSACTNMTIISIETTTLRIMLIMIAIMADILTE